MTCHPILLDLITLMIYSDVYKLWSSALRSHQHPPITSFCLGPNSLLSTLFSNTINLCSPLMRQTRFYIYTKQEVTLWFHIF
jgi:hypothetical protein